MAQQQQGMDSNTQINMGGGPAPMPSHMKKEDKPKQGNGGGLRGKAPETFDGT